MKYSEISIASTPEVLKRKLGAEYLKDKALHASAFTNGKCAAGTAITEDGKLSTGDGSDVYGVLLNDIYDSNPNGSVIVTSAVINKKNTTVSDDDIAALAAKVVLFE